MTDHKRVKGQPVRKRILEVSIPLFAATGFSGVSMRTIARLAGLNAATLYHYFPDKQALYIAAIQHAFSKKATALTLTLAEEDHAGRLLHRLVTRLAQIITDDPDFCRLVQRELLDGDIPRLRMLAKEVFQDIFAAIKGLGKELAPELDPHLTAISIIGLVIYHYETSSIRPFLPGYRPEHEIPETLAGHISRLLARPDDSQHGMIK